MPDSNIGSLPQVPNLDDSSLMVVEQQGQAMKMTGAQFKDFGRQSVVAEVQGYLDATKKAAQEATGAVSAVVDMTVEAKALEAGQEATVIKSIKNDVFNLAFGLPRGEKGEPGEEGPIGPRGARGLPGTGLKILGYYDTEQDLEAAQPTPEAGDAYGIGVQAPYDIYVFDEVSGTWKNNGQLTGGGTVIPEDVVTAEGGASIEFSSTLGEAPVLIMITDEEDAPLTAMDVTFDGTAMGVDDITVQEAVDKLFTSVSDGKALVASAITDKGIITPPDATFTQMAGNIANIASGVSTEDATANPGDILAPKTAYTASGKVEGIIPTIPGRTFTPGTADQTIASGQYLGGTQIIRGDTNLVSANIKKGVTLFGVDGAMEQSFLAKLTVTVDIGAVVTAKNGDTEISALCTTGAVTLELPIEGQWVVTAQRGVAQYNSVTVTVSSNYTASLIAELHIEYYGDLGAISLSARHAPAAGVSFKDNALFGFGTYYSYGTEFLKTVYKYDSNLTKTTSSGASDTARAQVGAAAVGNHALFAGGYYRKLFSDGSSQRYSTKFVSAFDESLTFSAAETLSETRQNLKGASVGNLALFAGGNRYANSMSTALTKSAVVDAYDNELTHTIPTILSIPDDSIEAAANQNYAVFAGEKVTAYNASASRTVASDIDGVPTAGALAGNYALFVSGTMANAYDLFLTRTIAELPTWARTAGTTVNGYAVFTGGEPGGETMAADVYDAFLVRTIAKSPFTAGANDSSGKAYEAFCAATAGSKGLFPGANRKDSSNLTYNVLAYQYV